MSNCNIVPIIVIVVIIIIALYLLSRNPIVTQNQQTNETKEQFIPYRGPYRYLYGYPYNRYYYYRRRYPYVRWGRYGNYYYPYGGYFSPYAYGRIPLYPYY